MQKSSLIFGSPQREPLLIVISGPSGIGKDAVVGLLRKNTPDTHFVITMTTRAPRDNETHGVDYFFVDQDTFEDHIANNELLEYAKVYSDYKGIPKSQVREAFATGKDVIMRLDVQGAMTIRKLCPDAVLIFLTAASKEEWLQRLIDRRSETPDELALRIETAEKEYALIEDFDYLVVNSHMNIEQTISDIQAIISTEHMRTKPRKVEL